MTNLATSPDLLARIKDSAKRIMSEEEIRRQKVSLIASAMDDDTVSHAEIEKALRAMDGKSAA